MKLRKMLLLVLAAMMLVGCAKVAEEKELEMEVAQDEFTNPDLRYDFSGSYKNDNEDTIALVATDNKSSYKVDFSVLRLCQMEGEGNWVDGGIEIEFDDPSGNKMYGVFFPEDDGTFVLRITQSSWDYIPEQTDYTGFVLSEANEK